MSTWRKGCLYEIYHSFMWLHYIQRKRKSFWFVDEFNKILHKWIFCLNFQQNNLQSFAFVIVEFYWKNNLMFNSNLRVWNTICCQYVACFEISDFLKHCNLLYINSFWRRFNKEWVLMINQLFHVSLKQYWQIFYLFLIFCCYFTWLKAWEISL